MSMKWDIRFLELAKLVSTWSKDPSTQTGAVIVSPNRSVISVGYNGFPVGMLDLRERYENRVDKYERTVHCEMNAAMTARQSLHGCTLYTHPFLSCPRCAVHMIQLGIVRVVAPKCPTEKADRWEPQFLKTREYFRECNVEVVEI